MKIHCIFLKWSLLLFVMSIPLNASCIPPEIIILKKSRWPALAIRSPKVMDFIRLKKMLILHNYNDFSAKIMK